MLGSCCAAPLNLCFEDVPQKPWTTPDQSGLNLTLLRQVEKLLGEHFVFSPKPWKRCQEETRTGVVDGFFASANSDERRLYSAFPVLPDGSPDKSTALYEDRFDLYFRNDSKGDWDGKKLTSTERPILAQRGYQVASILREQGYRVDESVKSGVDGLRYLEQDRADVAVLQGGEARELASSDPRYADIIHRAPIPYVVMPLYLAINQKIYDANPKRIIAIWNAIRQVRESAEYRAQAEAAGVR